MDSGTLTTVPTRSKSDKRGKSAVSFIHDDNKVSTQSRMPGRSPSMLKHHFNENVIVKPPLKVSVTHSPDLVAASGFDESSTTDQTASVSTWVEMRRKSAPVKPKETSYASSEFSPGPNYPAFDFPFERIAIATTDKYATLTKSSLVTTQHKNPQLQPSLHPDPSHVSLSEFQRPTARNRPSQTGQAESYVSLRKRASHSMNSLTPSHNRLSTQTQQQEKEALDDSSSLGGVKQHPIVQWLLERQTEMMESVWFAKFILFLSNDRTQIIIYLAIMLFIHTMLVVLFILTLSIVMPGIWVYNFMQIFVIVCTLIAHWASHKLSTIIKTSITAGDLIRGRINIQQLGDYWIDGPSMPAYKIIFTSSMIEFVADAIVVGSSISFSWEKELSLIHVGECQPPAYVNSTLPPGIDPTQYLQGDVDYAEVYNYGLPMADGLVGGWAGWPVSNPLNSFQIQSEGPVYVIQVLCDNGIYRPDIDNGLGTSVKSHVIEHDSRSLFLEIETTFPPSSVWDDISNSSVPVSVVQTCSSLVTVGYGAVSFQFVVDQWQMVTNGQMQSVNSLDGSFKAKYPTSIQQYTDQAHNVFKHYDDKFGILPLMTESIMSLFRNATYFPSQGATFCNILSEGTLPDGFYHTETTYRGISTGIGIASHFAIMQYQQGLYVPCNYLGYAGSGRLVIPDIAVWLSTASSIVAILIKLFEILWWAMAQSGLEYHSYRRARRCLRNPMRFAIDAAEMLAGGMQAGENSEDTCDVTNKRAIEELGVGRIVYGEDLTTRDSTIGHLRVGEYGKVKSIPKDKLFGTVRDENLAELDELLSNGRAAKLPGLGSTAKRQAYAKANLHNLIKKVPFLRREVLDGRDSLFEESVAAALQTRLCKKNELIVCQGDIGHEIYFVANGKFRVLLNDKVVGTLGEGTFFGELALLGDAPRAATIQAATAGRLYLLRRAAFDEILHEFEDVRKRMDDIAEERRAQLMQVL